MSTKAAGITASLVGIKGSSGVLVMGVLPQLRGVLASPGHRSSVALQEHYTQQQRALSSIRQQVGVLFSLTGRGHGGSMWVMARPLEGNRFARLRRVP